MRKLIEAGRLELNGAAARFKSRGTLEAFDRNLALLGTVRVRMTPTPDLKIFADLEFPDEVFRVWQESTIVNYRDFLDKVEFSGIDNYRALVRHLTTAVREGRDVATREFAEKKAPPERFVSAEEFATYDAAITGAKPTSRPPVTTVATAAAAAAPAPVPAAAPASAPTPGAAASPSSAPEQKRAAEIAWKRFAVEAAAAKREEPNGALLGGAVLSSFGVLMMIVSLVSLMRARELPENAPNVFPLLALGLALGMALVLAGILFMRRKPR